MKSWFSHIVYQIFKQFMVAYELSRANVYFLNWNNVWLNTGIIGKFKGKFILIILKSNPRISPDWWVQNNMK